MSRLHIHLCPKCDTHQPSPSHFSVACCLEVCTHYSEDCCGCQVEVAQTGTFPPIWTSVDRGQLDLDRQLPSWGLVHHHHSAGMEQRVPSQCVDETCYQLPFHRDCHNWQLPQLQLVPCLRKKNTIKYQIIIKILLVIAIMKTNQLLFSI